MSLKNKVLTILVVSFVIQLAYLSIRPLNLPYKDALLYDTIARNISVGRGVSIDGVHPVAIYPAYPLFLSVVYLIFGYNYFIIQLLLSICISVSCILLYLLGRIIFGEKPAFLAALLYALFPPVFGLSRIMYAEPLFILLIYASIYLAIQYIYGGVKKAPVFLSGIIFGVAILTKPIVIYFPVFIAVLIFFALKPKKALVFALFFNLGVAVAMIPWVARNYIHFGDVRPVSSFAFREGKLQKVDFATQYNSNEEEVSSTANQVATVVKFYQEAGIKPPDNPESIVGIGKVKGFWDTIRLIYLTSYSDILDIKIPFNLAAEKKLLKGYWYLFLLKGILFCASFIYFSLGFIGMIRALKIERKTIVLAGFFISYPIVFYLFARSMTLVGICSRYGIPMAGILILFTVSNFYCLDKKSAKESI